MTDLSIGERVRALRSERGLSQQALATNAGIAIRTLVRVESGEDFTFSTLQQIAAALAISVGELIGDGDALRTA
jgi:transcriptional regulator with XRE-family HTH domain